MMDAAFSTMSSIDICSQMGNHSTLLQFSSSDSGSPVASTPPLMHTLQPMLSEAPDTLAEYVDRLPKDEIDLMSSVVTSFSEVPEQKSIACSMHSFVTTSYSEQYTSANALDVKPSIELLPPTSKPLSSSSAVPYHISVPIAQTLDNQSLNSHYYFTSTNGQIQNTGFEQSSASPQSGTNVLCRSAASSPLVLTPADSSASPTQGDNVTLGSPRFSKPDLPTPPKKPLTPYMRFSKGIWQQVKGTHPGLTVCEVGATIGRMWRELSDYQKQQFNEEFAHDKVKYDGELQSYLVTNGLQASDLVKPRGKKKDVKDKPPAVSVATSHNSIAGKSRSVEAITLTPEQMAEEMARTILESAGMTGDVNGLPNFSSQIPSSQCENNANAFLPHFSQVWSGQELMFNGTEQMSMTNGGSGMPNPVPVSQQLGMNFQAPDVCSGQRVNVGVQQTAHNPQFQLPQFELGPTSVCDQQISGSDPAAWLWSQIGFGSLDAGKMVSAANALPVTVNQTFCQIATSNSTSRPNCVTTGSDLTHVFSMSDVLEPGEVRIASSDANIVNGISNGQGMSELTLLREALSAKGKEASRLTRELERAYGLIQRLQQQNIMFQQLEWNLQQQMQQPNESTSDALSNEVRS